MELAQRLLSYRFADDCLLNDEGTLTFFQQQQCCVLIQTVIHCDKRVERVSELGTAVFFSA